MTEDEFACVRPDMRASAPRTAGSATSYALADRDLLDDTLIVFTSDHGCMMGEQGEIHKAENRLRNQVTQVPLLIRHPQGEAAGARWVVSSNIRTSCPPYLQSWARKCLTAATAKTSGRWRLRARERARADHQRLRLPCLVRNRRWNHIAPWTELPEGRGPGRRELYDLQADPEELTNVIDAHREVADEMQAWLSAYIGEHRGETTGNLGPGESGPAHDQAYI